MDCSEMTHSLPSSRKLPAAEKPSTESGLQETASPYPCFCCLWAWSVAVLFLSSKRAWTEYWWGWLAVASNTTVLIDFTFLWNFSTFMQVFSDNFQISNWLLEFLFMAYFEENQNKLPTLLSFLYWKTEFPYYIGFWHTFEWYHMKYCDLEQLN